MKSIKTILIAATIITLSTLTASAQSWGFTLGNGAGFSYSRGGNSRNHYNHNQHCGNSYSPVYYAVPQQTVYCSQPAVYYPQNVNVIVRPLPYTYNTSYQISYPNRW